MSRKLLNLCLTALFGAISTAAWALSEVNGVYQIGTAEDLEEFAVLVNDGNVYACAELTADIDRGIDGTMIGVWNSVAYQGTFDGKGHTIKINMYPEDVNGALFQYTGFGAVIQNLKVTGTITTASKFAAGIVARNYGIIRGCYADVTINSSVPGDATHGGIAAVGYGGCTVEDCLAKVTITGETTTNCGGVVGWAEKRINIANCLVVSDGSTFAYNDASNGHSSNLARNEGNLKVIDLETYNADPYANRPQGACYNNYVTVQWGDNVACTVVPYDDLADGRICYQLNNDQSRIAWVQKLGDGGDPFPVPAAFGSIPLSVVYASDATDCDGKSEEELTFSNTPSNAITTAHTFDKYGVCTACGCFDFHAFEFDDPTKFDPTDRSVLLGSVEDIDKVEGWNRIANGFRLNMKMVNDIEYIAEPGKYIFNSSDWIDGNFNGQGHAFTMDISEVNGYAGLFPEMTGNIENLILHGSLQTNGARVGSLCAEARMALVRNVYSDVDITSTVAGDNTSGGFFGWTGDKEKHVENCIYAGTFTLPGAEGGAHCARVGGFAGWTAAKTYYTNCAVLGNIIGAGNQTMDDETENSQNIARNPGSVVAENVYIVNPIEGNDVSDHDKYTHYENEDGIANGELAFFLNGKQNGLDRFYQLIGTDPEPMPIKKEGALIYTSAGQFNCDGTPIGDGFSYTNSSSGDAVIPPHQFEDGWCVNCGKFDENFVTPVDGWFEVSSGAELAWWSNYAAAHTDVCVRLTDNIDMSDYMERFAQVYQFSGEFDGQGHTISNFILENNNNYNGLIATIVDGANIHDFVFDETCSLFAANYAGIIGSTDGSGTIYITNVGFEGTVGVFTRNAAGIIGCCSGGSMNMMITNCWVSGEITGGVESGAICGYSGSGSVVKDCWSTCQMPSASIYSSDSFTRGSAKVVNCYEADIEGVEQNKQQHYNPTAADRKTITLPLEDVASGALCYNLNGKQFLNPSWYQTLEEDEHPYPFDTHGVVIGATGKFFSIPNDDLNSVASAVQSAEDDAAEDIIATQSLLDALDTAIEALTEVETLEEFANAVATVEEAKAAVKESADAYKAYIDKCEEVKAYLAANTDFSGEQRTTLEYYLSDENVDAPNENNPLGTYEYIIDEHVATTEEIKAETERVTKWLQEAIATGEYAPGADISGMIPNSDFSKQNESWTGGFGNGWGTTQDEEGNTYYGVEAWNKTGEMYQTVEGLKPGFYLVGTHAAFRPSNNVYGTNYAAGIYANGIFNYFPTAIEDILPEADALDGENCNLEGAGAHDFEVYYNEEDGEIIPDEITGDNIGYVIQGETGMAIAAKAGRYPVYTIAYVGEDGKLTIGIKNPGTNYGNDWTGWGALKVTYCGESGDGVTAAFGTVLENMNARANTILYKYEPDDEDVALAPNFPDALKTALMAAQEKIEGAETVEAQAELAQEFSDIFENIYAGKQAYRKLYDSYLAVEYIIAGNLALMEKNEETGEWEETEEYVISDDELGVLYDYEDALIDGYTDGTYSTEEALNPPADPAVAEIIPAKDEDGYYLIGTTKQFVAYRAIASDFDKYAKGKLTADIDMAGVQMQPIGHNRGESAKYIFAGVFDGQGHTLANVFIDDEYIPSGEYAEPATLFYELQSATVKNFKLTGEFHTSHQFTGPVTRWMSGSSTIDNVEVEATLYLAPNLSGDTSSGGLIGRNGSANSLISNCLVNTHVIGEGDNPHWYFGGVAGWADASLKIQNTLILSQYDNVGVDGDNSRTISRGTKCTPTNVYVSQHFREAEGTLVTDEQLASGEVAWKLNGSTGDDAHWFQTLGVDTIPHLFGGDVVYYYGGKYINDKPNPQLNAFAYNLKATRVGKNVAVRFDLNAEAEAASVSFYDGEALVCTKDAGTNLAAGTHSVNVSVDELGGNDPSALNFKIQVTGKGSLDVLRVGDVYKVWAPYGMAVNNNPESKNFGQVMIAETWATQYPNGYISTEKSGALFAFDQNFKPINAADGTPGFYGGLPIPQEIEDGSALIISGDLKYDMKDLQFSPDGRLFVARASGTSNSSVWEINPEDLNEPWKPVFTGGELDEATGITYVGEEEQNRMAIGLAFEGKGEDLKMYVLGAQRSNGDYNFTDYNCSIYNLGTATEWTAAPSANFEPLDGKYAYAPSHIGIHEDGQGGLWFIQSVSEASAEKPAIKHFDAEGNEDYSSTTSSIGGGRIAVTPDGQYIAIPNGSGKIVLYETNYVPMENGKIFLNPKQTISVRESSLASFAFDWANNLYVASGGTETFSRYTIPGMKKDVVTPGFGISKASADVNADGATDIADAVAVLNAMAGKQVGGDADVNGDGTVDIADAVAVLTIMAGN